MSKPVDTTDKRLRGQGRAIGRGDFEKKKHRPDCAVRSDRQTPGWRCNWETKMVYSVRVKLKSEETGDSEKPSNQRTGKTAKEYNIWNIEEISNV
ncbi:hypothetical protein MAR_010004 [Mya arenaria]|uniref:Uncharacterized protein n=1 Tax=Mya arenaria TaxID=6604 RepID=A0ABY7E8G9_MYAAR|nr:hypothetical protein MAR_010004 [Mya arenaria]